MNMKILDANLHKSRTANDTLVQLQLDIRINPVPSGMNSECE